MNREWNNLNPNTIYTISAHNGWALTLNGDGSVSLAHHGNGAPNSASTGMTIDPDPGTGTNPPGK